MSRSKLGSVVMVLMYACGQPARQSAEAQQSMPNDVSASSAATLVTGSAEVPNETDMASVSTAVHATSVEARTSDGMTQSTTGSSTESGTETALSSATRSGDGESTSNPASTTGETSSATTAGTLSTSDSADAGGSTEQSEDLILFAGELNGFYLHDACTASDPTSDVCTHLQQHEETFTFGGDPETTYEVRLRIRGLFEPTTISGGTTPYPEHPYFKLGGTVAKTDYSQWQIRVGEPEAVYYLNHYPATGHTIYKEDFEASIQVRGGAAVTVRVEDSNDRQIDNGYVGLPDRQQTLEGVTEGVVDGQVLQLDVLEVTGLE